MTKQQSEKVLSTLDGLLPELEPLYRDIHSHPEPLHAGGSDGGSRG